jgi:hypothetical protein
VLRGLLGQREELGRGRRSWACWVRERSSVVDAGRGHASAADRPWALVVGADRGHWSWAPVVGTPLPEKLELTGKARWHAWKI